MNYPTIKTGCRPQNGTFFTDCVMEHKQPQYCSVAKQGITKEKCRYWFNLEKAFMFMLYGDREI